MLVVAGGIVIAVVMILVVPIAVMLGGAVWSGLIGWLSSADADAGADDRATAG